MIEIERKEDYTNCLYCGATGVEWHHVVPRAQGGVDGPQVPLCRNCHTRRHNEELQIRQQDGTYAFIERDTGEITIRRLVPQLASSSSQLVNEARAIQHWLEVIVYSGKLKDEPTEVLKTLYDDLRELKHRAWMAQAAVISEFQSRSSYGDHMAAHVAEALGCSERTVQSRGQIFREIIANPLCEQACETLREEGFYKEAVSAGVGAVQAINLAAERKIGNPSYSVAQFREELRAPGSESTLRRIVLWCEAKGPVDERIAETLSRKYGVPVELEVDQGLAGATRQPCHQKGARLAVA
jgi:hypothetical protein